MRKLKLECGTTQYTSYSIRPSAQNYGRLYDLQRLNNASDYLTQVYNISAAYAYVDGIISYLDTKDVYNDENAQGY